MNKFLTLNAEEISNLYPKAINQVVKSAGLRSKIYEAYHFIAAEPHTKFDGQPFPLDDCYGNMVRAIQEAVCPVCGCGLVLENVGKPNPMDQYTIVGKCRNGHENTAEPSEDGYGDWVAY